MGQRAGLRPEPPGASPPPHEAARPRTAPAPTTQPVAAAHLPLCAADTPPPQRRPMGGCRARCDGREPPRQGKPGDPRKPGAAAAPRAGSPPPGLLALPGGEGSRIPQMPRRGDRDGWGGQRAKRAVPRKALRPAAPPGPGTANAAAAAAAAARPGKRSAAGQRTSGARTQGAERSEAPVGWGAGPRGVLRHPPRGALCFVTRPNYRWIVIIITVFG